MDIVARRFGASENVCHNRRLLTCLTASKFWDDSIETYALFCLEFDRCILLAGTILSRVNGQSFSELLPSSVHRVLQS